MLIARQLAELYQRVAQEELGLIANIDDDGDVVFQHPDLGYMFFDISVNDPEFMRLVYPNFVDEAELHITHEALLEAISDTNRRCKSIKLYFSRSGSSGTQASTPRVSAAIEAFVAANDTAPSEALLRAVMRRCIRAVCLGVYELCKVAKEEEQDKGMPVSRLQ